MKMKQNGSTSYFLMLLLSVMGVGSLWLWQFLKFRAQKGAFHYLSPQYGDVVLHALSFACLVVLLFAMAVDLRKLAK